MTDNVIDVDFNSENDEQKRKPKKINKKRIVRKSVITLTSIGCGVVVSVGATKIISKAVEMAVPPQAKPFAKAMFKMGGYALDGIAINYILGKADAIAKGINTIIDGGVTISEYVKAIVKMVENDDQDGLGEVLSDIENKVCDKIDKSGDKSNE